LRRVAGERGLDWIAGDEPFAARREAQLDKLGDLVAENVDREALLRLVENGSPEGLPIVSSQFSVVSNQLEAGQVIPSHSVASRNGTGAPSYPTVSPGAVRETEIDKKLKTENL
jgi:adenosylcobyric acid synthase